VGITVSRRVGSAVVRNRVKRRLREIMRQEHPRLVEGWDLVIVVRPAAAAADFAALSAAALSLLRRAGLIAAFSRQVDRTGL
jgi:ribonuclease P protein component